MAAFPTTAERRSQLVLFNEQPTLPRWSDLAESTQVEVVNLLAQLLVSVRTASPLPQKQGGRDE
jgi:hypothetical protein